MFEGSIFKSKSVAEDRKKLSQLKAVNNVVDSASEDSDEYKSVVFDNDLANDIEAEADPTTAGAGDNESSQAA